jgi:uncharacterized protein (DUF433 family)
MKRATRKAEPFSIRLGTEEDRFVKDEARRLRRSRGAVVEAYAREAITMRRFPGIAFRGDDYRRRAWVVGTGLDVWEVVALLRDFGSEEKLADEYELTRGQIRIALAYQREFRDEIDDLIDRGRPSEEELRTRYPFVVSFDGEDSGGGS